MATATDRLLRRLEWQVVRRLDGRLQGAYRTLWHGAGTDFTDLRTYTPEVPPRVEYEISDLGRSLSPLFATLATWSADHLDGVEAARLRYDAARRA